MTFADAATAEDEDAKVPGSHSGNLLPLLQLFEITHRRSTADLVLVYKQNETVVSADAHREVLWNYGKIEHFPEMQNHGVSLWGVCGRDPLRVPGAFQSLRWELG